jgi:hypothetical protein
MTTPDDLVKLAREHGARVCEVPYDGIIFTKAQFVRFATRIASQKDALQPAPVQQALTELEDVLIRNGFVRCDIAACNCGSWHARYGLKERMAEIKEALADAGHPLCNENSNLVLNALRELIAERDALASQAREPEWRGIDSAPEGEPVVVFWLEEDDATDHPERYEIDFLDDGVWQHHDDNYQHFCAVAPPGSTGPSERAPYTHWKPLGLPSDAIKETR